MTTEIIVLKILLCIIILFVVGSGLYLMTGGLLLKFFYHDVLEWHIPDHNKDHYRGINYCSVCKICGKEIMQDSQGNWF